MNRKMVAGTLIILMLVSILAFSACSAQRRPGPDQTSPARETDRTKEDTATAQRIADRVSDLEEVNTATVIVSANMAWVGVDLKANTQELTTTIKDKITRVVKNEDNNLRTVYVTADADTVTRLRNIARDIARGQPVSGFRDELNEIGRRITPSME